MAARPRVEPKSRRESLDCELRKPCRDQGITDSAILDYLSAINCPRSLTVYLLYKYTEHDQLSQLDIDPKNYIDYKTFRDDYAATRFLSKASFLKTTFDKKAVALQKYLQCEQQCLLTNRSFVHRTASVFRKPEHVELFHIAQRKISSILGSLPSPDRLFDECAWGPGSTLSVKRDTASNTKYRLEDGITSDLVALMRLWLPNASPLYASYINDGYRIQESNVLTFVPKNSKTDRSILIQPGFNLYVQKGIGSVIRRRLKRCGIDLDKGAQKHGLLAKQASILDDLATIDFTSASDTISVELVRELLPSDWYQLLDVARCKSRSLSIGTKDYLVEEKFSAMGNGFSFELESLIFYSLAYACTIKYSNHPDLTVSVFGDDVILPSDVSAHFRSISEAVGFTVNESKSYDVGSFRESCGSYFFDGIDVKPVYLKEELSNASAVFKLANGIRLYAHRVMFNYNCDIRFRRTFYNLRRRVPRTFRFLVPATEGDVGFISNLDEALASRTCLRVKPIYKEDTSAGLLITRLREIKGTPHFFKFDKTGSIIEHIELVNRASGNRYTIRDRVRLGIGKYLCEDWYDLGMWV